MAEIPFRLHDLPVECVYAILSFLNVDELICFARASSENEEIVAANSENLYRLASYNSGYFNALSASAQSLRPGRYSVTKLSPEFDSEELKNVIAAQRSMSLAYSDVKSWKSFAETRRRIDLCWLQGSFQLSALRLLNSRNSQDRRPSIFRFKLDPEAKLIVTSSAEVPGLLAYQRSSGSLYWSTSQPAGPYSHVELSDGFLVTCVGDDEGLECVPMHSQAFIVWVRSDIDCAPSPFPVPPEVQSFETTSYAHDTAQAIVYTPYAFLLSQHLARATKLRYPVFVAAAQDTYSLSWWNIENGEHSVLRINPTYHTPYYGLTVTYVEVDTNFIYVAGLSDVSIWSFDGRDMGSFPSRADRRSDFFQGPTFDLRGSVYKLLRAVHHSNGHGVAIASKSQGSNGALIWTPNIQDAALNPRESMNTTVVLEIPDTILELSVENDRVVFMTANDQQMNGLWYIPLRKFLSLEDFRANPPTPKVLCFPLPTIVTPSRIEMTGDEIYVPAQSRILESEEYAKFRFNCSRKMLCEWTTLGGGHLSSVVVEGPKSGGDLLPPTSQRDFSSEADEVMERTVSSTDCEYEAVRLCADVKMSNRTDSRLITPEEYRKLSDPFSRKLLRRVIDGCGNGFAQSPIQLAEGSVSIITPMPKIIVTQKEYQDYVAKSDARKTQKSLSLAEHYAFEQLDCCVCVPLKLRHPRFRSLIPSWHFLSIPEEEVIRPIEDAVDEDCLTDEQMFDRYRFSAFLLNGEMGFSMKESQEFFIYDRKSKAIRLLNNYSAMWEVVLQIKQKLDETFGKSSVPIRPGDVLYFPSFHDLLCQLIVRLEEETGITWTLPDGFLAGHVYALEPDLLVERATRLKDLFIYYQKWKHFSNPRQENIYSRGIGKGNDALAVFMAGGEGTVP